MNLYKQIKSLIPNSLKYPLWFIVKAPQRNLSASSLRNDLKGIFIYLKFVLFPQRKLKRISVCTGIYNRTENYLNQLLFSLNEAKNKHMIELSVFDCGSTDTQSLYDDIRKQWQGDFVYHAEHTKFTRSYAFNQAVQQCTSEIIFVCDADMSLPHNIVTLVNQYTGPKVVWYPICFFLFKNKLPKISKQNGIWQQYASGMFAALKTDYINIGGLDEKFVEWGYEDTDLWERFHRDDFVVIRNRQRNFFHHWHNTFNPKYKHLNDE